MRKPRFLESWQNSTSEPAVYHLTSRMVDRRFVLAERKCEAFHARFTYRMYVLNQSMKGLLWSFRDLRVGV